MPDKDDWRISTLLMDSADGFKHHTERIGRILDGAQKKFERDHTSTVAAVSIGVIALSFALAFWSDQWTVSSIGLIGGVVGLIASLIVRHQSAGNQLKYASTMVALERERAEFQQRAAVMQHVWLHGLPEGTSLAQLEVLMGRVPSVSAAGAPQPAWKELPTRERSDPESPTPEKK